MQPVTLVTAYRSCTVLAILTNAVANVTHHDTVSYAGLLFALGSLACVQRLYTRSARYKSGKDTKGY